MRTICVRPQPRGSCVLPRLLNIIAAAFSNNQQGQERVWTTGVDV